MLFWEQFAPVLAAAFALVTLPGLAAHIAGPGSFADSTVIETASAILFMLFLAIVSFGGVAALGGRALPAAAFLRGGLAAARPGLLAALVMGAVAMVGLILLLLARGHPLDWLVRGAVTATLIWLLATWLPAIPAAVVERLGPTDALRRAAVLTRRHRGRIVGVLAIGLLALIPGAVLVNTVVFGPTATPESAQAALAAMSVVNPGLWVGALYELLALGVIACLPPVIYVALVRAQ